MISPASSKQAREALERAYRAPAVIPLTPKRRLRLSLAALLLWGMVQVAAAGLRAIPPLDRLPAPGPEPELFFMR